MADAPTDAYGRSAQFYAKVIDPINAPLRDATVAMSPLVEGASVLDIGCGTGELVAAYAEVGASVAGVDLSDGMLAIARERLGGAADLRSADATELPFPDNRFDLVTASLILHELTSPVQQGVVAEMVRVTRPGGHLLIADFRIGPLRVKGRLLRVFSTLAERLAGREHHHNWRLYMASGGMPAVLDALGLEVEREKIVGGGNMSLWLVPVPSK